MTFRQLSANAGTYRDAVEFRNGVKVRLQELNEGQEMEVVALSSEKVGIQKIHSSRRQLWRTELSHINDRTLAIPEEAAEFYSDGRAQIPGLIGRFIC